MGKQKMGQLYKRLTALFVMLMLFVLPQVGMGDDALLTFEGTCGANLTWKVTADRKTLTIKGYGEMTDFTSGANVPWEDHQDTITSVVFDEEGGDILSIGNYALYDLNMTAIELPKKLQRIGNYAFSSNNIISIILPGSCQSIGSSAFSNCYKLASIALPNGITEIPGYAFYGCSALESIGIPASVTKINASAFDACSKLKKVDFSGTKEQANAITIGNSNTEVKEALWMCSDGETMLGMADGGDCGEHLKWMISEDRSALTIFGYGTMTDYTSGATVPWADHQDEITSVTFVEDGGDILSIGNYALYDLNMTAIELPKKLQRIGNYAFSSNNIISIILPGSCQSIGSSAFSNCYKLASIALPNGITEIPGYAFYGCSALESIGIPASVTKVNASAFDACSKLKKVDFSGTKEQANAITIGDSNTEVKEALWTCSNGDMYQGMAFSGSCGENLSWRVSEDRSALTITGCGEMTDYASGAKVPWADHQKKITSVTFVEDGGDILSIGNYALYDLNMTAIELPKKLQRIGNYAFSSNNIISIILPGSCQSIGSSAFSNCYKLASIALPNGITEIPGYAFYGCSALETVTLPLSVAKINASAFSNCNNIKDVYYDGALEDAQAIDFTNTNYDLKEAVWHYKKTGLSDNPQDGDIVEDGKLPEEPVTGPVLVVDQYGTIQGADIKYDKTNGNQGGNNKKNTVTYNVHLLDPEGYGLDLPELEDGQKYTLIFPYPEGLDQNSANKYRIIIHHYASGTLTNPKDPTKPEIFKSEDGDIEFLPQGIAVKISSFSPFVISWETKAETFDLTVVKEWDVPEGTELPESIQVNLFANKEPTAMAQLTAETNWTYTWEELPVKDEDDILIEYEISEVELEGYISIVGDPVETDTGVEIAITNTLIEEEDPQIPTTNLTVVKEWDVPEGTELPESILVNLYADGGAIAETQLTAETNWTFTWEGLPKFEGDSKIEYTVKEEPVEGYQTSVSDPVETETGMEIVITNTLNEEEDPDIPDEEKFYPVVITKVLKGISAKDLPEDTVFEFIVIDGNNGDTDEGTYITRQELIDGNGTASQTIMTKYAGGMRIGEKIASAQIDGYDWRVTCAVTGDAQHTALDKAYDINGYVCSDMIKPETGLDGAVVTYTNIYEPIEVDLPKTGDNSRMALWIAMLGAAGAAMFMLRKRVQN